MFEQLSFYWKLFISFVKPGLLGFGGGPASIPFIEKEVCDKNNWMTHEEFFEALALGNSLPGPITTKLAAIVGYKVGGITGMTVAITGMVVPTAILVVLLTNLYMKYKNIPKIEGIIHVLKVVVVVLLLQVTWELGKNGITDKLTICIFIAATIAIFTFKLHPLLVIVLAIVFALIFL
ncbi:chromate transporter [Alteribacillus bidgolensis]|uniref:Chromate transporter n=1 Tax=Alteribacillus bidgolensis TaxID=930129 RepID=A0A1G8K5X0_9BACI|nr:chromate transporter [Alteribacillus bidgolensis]SDI38210.1 chromate transporter [Alteribacillus bidgolensis]